MHATDPEDERRAERAHVAPAGPAVVIGHDEAHVWTVEPDQLSDGTALGSYQAVLSAHEADRLQRLKSARDRRAFLAAHALARFALSSCVPAVPPDAWTFATTRHGRPEIANPALPVQLRFNLSHTHGLVACVVVAVVDCGVDVEVTEHTPDLLRIAPLVLSQAELAVVRAIPVGGRTEQFFRHWTLKEAYAKARGLGLSLPFDRFGFHISPRGISFDPAPDERASDWQFDQWPATARHTVAIALRHGAGANYRVVRHASMPARATSHRSP
jgi:4'-phosphopantetheinyl transferase